jgi:hypothetical protein
MRWHEPTRAYVTRRRQQGLTTKEIMRCLKRLIARQIFYVLRRLDTAEYTPSTRRTMVNTAHVAPQRYSVCDLERVVTMEHDRDRPVEESNAEQLAARRDWFEQYAEALNTRSVVAEPGSGPHACPCCREPTLDGRGMYEICPVCGWEDDGQDDQDAEDIRGGPNGPISLAEARRHYEVQRARQDRKHPRPGT